MALFILPEIPGVDNLSHVEQHFNIRIKNSIHEVRISRVNHGSSRTRIGRVNLDQVKSRIGRVNLGGRINESRTPKINC